MYVKARGEDYFYPSGKHEIQWVCNCDCNPSIDILVKASNLNCKNPILSCGCKLHDKKATDMIYQVNMVSDGRPIPIKSFILI